MAEKTFDELLSGAQTIRDNELPESNTHALVGEQLVNMVEKSKEESGKKLAISDLASGRGESTTTAMTQAAVTQELVAQDEKLTELSSKVGGVGYVTCDTAAGTAAKVVTVTGLTSLTTGIRLLVKMTNKNTASNAALNINSLGAKPLFYNNTRVSGDNAWEAGEVLDVFYDGTNFYSSNVQGGSGEGGNKILEWNTDAATTRKQVTLTERKAGMQISYKLNGENWVNEQYIGTSLTDTEWAKDDNWNKISTDLELEVFARQNSEILGKSETIEKTTSESNKKFSLKVYNGENYEYIIENLSDIKTANFLFLNGSRVVKSISMSVGEIIRGFIEIKGFVENDGLFIGANVSQQSNTHFKCTISLTNTLVEDVNNLKETSLEKSDVDFIRSLEDVREEDFEYILDRSSIVGTVDVSNVLFTTRDTILNNVVLVSLEFNSIPTVADNTFYIGQVIYNEANTQATITRIYSFPMPTDSKTIDLGGVEFKKNEYFLFGMEKADACFKWRYADMGVTFDFNGVNHNVGSISTTTTSRGKYAPIKIYANKGQLILPNIASYIDNKIKGPESSAEKRIVSVDDATTVLMNGSSLTNAICHTSSTSWIERLNDIVDVVLINNGKSGKNFRYNIQKLF